jgi:hypothetical protein
VVAQQLLEAVLVLVLGPLEAWQVGLLVVLVVLAVQAVWVRQQHLEEQ